MPKDTSIKKVLVIGSGPIVIGQAAEFDYAGAQACRVLKSEGIEAVLVNSNPATIMTDKSMASEIYLEPLKKETVERIILKEKPDSLLAGLGGQTGLTIAMQLSREGFLEKHGVRLIGTNAEAIDRAEDRQLFKDTMASIGQPCIPSDTAEDLEACLAIADRIGYPVIVRPAFTLGGAGGGAAMDRAQLETIAANGLALSPIHQVLIEKYIAGWKEIEFEVMRDAKGNAITICSMENVDPVGIHTGDSIVVAPAMTLSSREYGMLRKAALDIITALQIEGGCNVQFALNPDSFEYAVIEVNPRVSRSSALASKATGYPIAKVTAKIALGYTLDEIRNDVTGTTYACFEPAIDYIVVKLPKWPFDKFVKASRLLGTQMKATGEAMAIGQSVEEALMKAVRGAEIGMQTLSSPLLDGVDARARLSVADDLRLFTVYKALKEGVSPEEINAVTKIDLFFIHKLKNLADYEALLAKSDLTDELYLRGKKLGFTDESIAALSGQKIRSPRLPSYKMVDTCAGEFAAATPYFYSCYDDYCEARAHIAASKKRKKKIIVLGSGPIRIGQGIEFDYSSVHCAQTLRKLGYEVIIINNNPETVSTDFDVSDRLYFEPLTKEDVWGVIEAENPIGVVVAFGGQTAIKLAKFLDAKGIRILGTSAEGIDTAEDRERFDRLLSKFRIKRPKGLGVKTLEQALRAAESIGYPVLLRPSYVIGGQNMTIAYGENDVRAYMDIILSQGIENPVLIDKYMSGIELEVDVISDGTDVLIPGIMEHIERAGVHSGDSIAVYPAWNINDVMTDKIIESSRNLAISLNTKGLVNIQYLIYHNELYVIEVNPRSSRTIPYISKVTGVPMVDIASRVMLGEKLADIGCGTGLHPAPPYFAVKVPVFSFGKLINVDTHLGPEMKSTGEVLGIAGTLEEALYKGLIAAGYKMKKDGGVFITVRDSDKNEIAETAKKYADLGFTLYATKGTAKVLAEAGIQAIPVNKIHEDDHNNTIELIESGKIQYVISTSSKGRIPTRDSVKIRRKAVERSIPCLTSIDTANAMANSLRSRYSPYSTELVDINDMRTEKIKANFTKMHGCGNDYIYFDCFQHDINNPEALSVRLSDRHYGIGGDGVILVCPSDVADGKMRMFNLDGSEGKMCGNGIRCVGKFLYDHGLVDPAKEKITVETLSGIKTLWPIYNDRKVCAMKVDMGKAELTPALIPVDASKLPDPKADRIVNAPYTVDGVEYHVTCVSMGNPHCVVFKNDVETMDIEKIGPAFETSELFPERVNTEFIRVLDDHTLKMRVWERGSGETWACGTGACAAAVAAVENGYCKKDTDITVKLIGGDLVIRYTDDTVYMTGNAVTVYEGVVEI